MGVTIDISTISVVTIENIRKAAYHDASIKNHGEKDWLSEKLFLSSSYHRPNGSAVKTDYRYDTSTTFIPQAYKC
jgi:hypothetical protein